MSEESNKSIAVTSNDNENANKIEKLKIRGHIKIAKLKKELAELKKEAAEKGIDLDDNEEDCVPLNEEEKEMVAQWKERVQKATKSPIAFTYTLDADGKEIGSIETIDGDPLSAKDKWEVWSAALNLATGSTNQRFAFRLFNLCSLASGAFKPDKHKGDELTALINAMQALKPQDEIEGMLISRLISLHYQSMKYLSCTNSEGVTGQGIDVSINRSAKLFRLYNETLEALMRYRRRGEQRVVVQHVNVNDGGKAIVGGNMVAGGGVGQ